MRRQSPLFAAALVLLLPAPLAAKDNDEAEGPPPAVFQAVVDCRALTDPAARLACYDRAVGALSTARESKDLVITDRASIREARRGLFGISLPKLKLFGGGEEVNEIESTITSVRASADGFPIFVLEDGARWKQTEGRNQFARSGQKIRIKRTGLGGFMANVNNQPGVRVIRIAN